MNIQMDLRPQKPFLCWILLLAFAAISGSAVSQSGSTPPIAPPTRSVLDTYKVSPVGNLVYQLSVPPCRAKDCDSQIRLLAGSSELSTVDLGWAKSHGPSTRQQSSESPGVGDPLAPRSTRTVWSMGEEEQNVVIAARTVRLTPRLNGLLVNQQAGFDHLKRRHDLYVAIDKKLVHAWSAQEGAGPTWSSVDVRDFARDHSQEILFFDGSHYPSDEQPDWLYFTVYHWNPSKNTLEKITTGNPSVFAVIAGMYDTVAGARVAQSSVSCLGAFWVLASDNFSRLPTGKFALGAISSRKSFASQTLAKSQACAPQLSVSLLESQYFQRDRD